MDYIEKPNSVIEDYTFDERDRLDMLRYFESDSDNADLSDNAPKGLFDYSYRADGKRVGVTEKFGDGWGFDSGRWIYHGSVRNTYTWSYDNAGRLISEVLDSSNGSIDQTETYVYDLVGNRMRKEVNKPATAYVDQIFAYNYDANDRITSETLDNGVNGTGVDSTTTHGWTQTQQTSKTVSVPSVSSVVQSMSYGLAGQLERVMTTTINGSGAVTGRTRVDYRYNPQGIRTISVDWNDANLDGTFAAGERTGSVEYLIENSNFTGYQQTILETVKNHAGQATKRTTYTFGTDEITQTVSQIDSSSQLITQSSTLTFAHDGKGSVRALFGAAAAIAQVFTYSAYGDLLAIHNGSGTLQPLASSLTSVLYNGEGFDARTGLYNMRARWYSASNARWERLDPFNGNPTDPFSFNKYGFVHGDPVQMTDPTGKMGLLGGFSVSGISNGLRAMGMPTFAAAFRGVAAFGGQAARYLGPKLLDLVKNLWLPTGSRYFFSGPFVKWFTNTITTYLARGGFTLGQGLITNSVLDENIGPVIASINSLASVAGTFEGQLGGVKGQLIACGASIASGRMQEVLDRMKFQNIVVDPLVTGQFGALANLGIFAHGIVQFQTQLGLLNEALTEYIQIGYGSLDNITRAKIDQRFGIQGGIQEIAIVPSSSTVIDAALGTLDPHREIDLLTIILRQIDQGGNQGAANDLITLIERMKNKYGSLEVNGRAI
jgi:RHS repeat-associated protein